MEMSDANDTGDTGSDASVGSEDSAVISALRKQLKESKANEKVALDAAETIAESTRSEIERGQAAAVIVNALGYPKMATDFADQVEGELTVETATAFLQSKGLEPKTADVVDDTDTKESTPADLAKDLAATANLGNRLADAASGAGATGAAQRVEAEIDKTESSEEVTAVMRAAGLLN